MEHALASVLALPQEESCGAAGDVVALRDHPGQRRLQPPVFYRGGKSWRGEGEVRGPYVWSLPEGYGTVLDDEESNVSAGRSSC